MTECALNIFTAWVWLGLGVAVGMVLFSILSLVNRGDSEGERNGF